jgi:uncharacterized lipoprotein YmbA
MKLYKLSIPEFLLIAATIAAGGCASLRESNYYLMSPVPPAQPAELAQSPNLGIGPVTLPDYLERTNIVTRESASRVRVAPDDKWAAPLEAHLAELMAENLRMRLGIDAVPVYPWPPATRVDLQLTMEVLELIHYQDSVHLAVRWRLLDGPSSAVVDRLSRFEEASGPEYDQVVDAMARALGRLADDIAATLRQAPKARHR